MNQPTYIIDFDSTIIRCESLDELARLTLRGRKDRETVLRRLQNITDQGMAGQLPFDESLRRRLRLFAPRRDHLMALIELLQHEITPSVRRHKEWFARNSERIYVISGGFEEYIIPTVANLGVTAEHVLANAFEFGDDGTIVGYDKMRLLSKAGGKVRQLAKLELPRPIIVIGDGYTDYEMCAAGEADEFWAFCENAKRMSVIKHAKRVLMSFDDLAKGNAIAVQ